MSLKHHIFHTGKPKQYKIALLIKDLSFNKAEIEKYYITPLENQGINKTDIIVFNLKYSVNNKAPVSIIKSWLSDNLYKAMSSLGVVTILCADPHYFKILTKSKKADPHYGYVLPGNFTGFTGMNVILSVNYAALFYNPILQNKLDISLKTLVDHTLSIHVPPGSDVIHSEYYPDEHKEIKIALEDLKKYPELTVDIETYSLEFNTAKIGTISFAWDEHNGIAFNVAHTNHTLKTDTLLELLKSFFIYYEGKLIFHGATFDIKILIYELFMNSTLDTRGMLEGLDVMYRNTHCTKIITYLATNTTAENKLDLKSNAAEFAGNWAQDNITDINKIAPQVLLKYNLVDCLSTWYLFKKNYPILVQDQQTQVYEEVMRPSMKVVTQMELTGMPMDIVQLSLTRIELQKVLANYTNIIRNSSLIIKFEKHLKLAALIAKNASLKVKVITEEEFADVQFNPNSNKQVGMLLHEEFEIEVTDTTPTGAPSVGADILHKHLNKLMIAHDITKEDLE